MKKKVNAIFIFKFFRSVFLLGILYICFFLVNLSWDLQIGYTTASRIDVMGIVVCDRVWHNPYKPIVGTNY